MGFANLRIRGDNIHLQITHSGVTSIFGMGQLTVGGQVVPDGRISILEADAGVEVGWEIVSSDALRIPSRMARSAFVAAYGELFPGFAEWLERENLPGAAIGVSDDAIGLGSEASAASRRSDGMVCTLVVLDPTTFHTVESWLRPSSALSQYRLKIAFDVIGFPTPELRNRLPDRWFDLNKGYDPTSRFMCVFAEHPDIRLVRVSDATIR